MNAIVLAGGFGARLAPLTDETIKPMLNIAGSPMIDYCIKTLKKANINDIVFALHHNSEEVENHIFKEASRDTYLKENSRLVDLVNYPFYRFSIEPTPLGTAGSVKHAEHLLHDEFVVISGDCLINIDINEMVDSHRKSGAALTMAVKSSDNVHLYGVPEFGEDGLVTNYVEKPQNEIGNKERKFVNCGVYVVSKSALDFVPKNQKFDFSKNLFPILLEKKLLNAHVFNGYWFDIGSFEQYVTANEFIFEKDYFRP
ncbi:MAG: nucleotidyltransferase family protein [Firmicutes bacterium]|nr:nucleotidyltransferase family protein [Bacillota bacterium]